jgi:hypothetical protein
VLFTKEKHFYIIIQEWRGNKKKSTLLLFVQQLRALQLQTSTLIYIAVTQYLKHLWLLTWDEPPTAKWKEKRKKSKR